MTSPYIVLVGYKLAVTKEAEAFMPAYEAPARTKDPDKIAAYVAEKKAEYIAKAATMPYTATFDEVFLSFPALNVVELWRNTPERGPGGVKPPVPLAVAKWLQNRCDELGPKIWPDNSLTARSPLVFLGFTPRTFLKILGLECSLLGQPLPPALWYGAGAEHLNIAEAIIPTEWHKDLDLLAVLKRRGITTPKDWTGPWQGARKDVIVTAEIGAQLGFFRLEDCKDAAPANVPAPV